MLATGAFGKVYSFNDTMVVKSTSIYSFEYSIGNVILHPNILKIHDTGLSKDGTSIDLLCERKFKNIHKIDKRFIDGILCGLSALNNLGFIYMDLHECNVMIDEKKESATLVDLSSCEIIDANGNIPKGIYLYMPPESNIDCYYSTKSQVWSIGMLFLILYDKQYMHDTYGKMLPKSYTLEIYNNIINRAHVVFTELKAPKYYYSFIMDCLIYDYNKRPSINVLIKKYNVIKPDIHLLYSSVEIRSNNYCLFKLIKSCRKQILYKKFCVMLHIYNSIEIQFDKLYDIVSELFIYGSIPVNIMQKLLSKDTITLLSKVMLFPANSLIFCIGNIYDLLDFVAGYKKNKEYYNKIQVKTKYFTIKYLYTNIL
jgi:serine/threonine protein kinase